MWEDDPPERAFEIMRELGLIDEETMEWIDNKGAFLTVDFGVVIEGISVYLLQYNEVEAVVMSEEEWRQNNGC